MRTIKDIIKRWLRNVGYELRVVSDNKTDVKGPDFWIWIKNNYNINTVIDIGANNGEFTQFLYKYFNPSKTYAFEPLPSCIPLIESKSSSIRNLEIFNLALSDYKGTAAFYKNNYEPSSSLLGVSNIHINEFPHTSKEIKINVNVAPMDDVINADNLKKDIFIKIDVQGVEDRVINGGKKVFSASKFILIEMSFLPLFKGQPLFEEVHALLFNMGFRFSGMKNQINSKKTGQPLFAHCLYMRA